MTSSKMDEELRSAALGGDVQYLKECFESSKPIEYYLSFSPSGKIQCGNIFHLAAMENREEFIREAMGILPQEAKQQLLLQTKGGIIKWNPLHTAAATGNAEIVKMFLEVYRCLPPDLSERPWLQKTLFGYTPCVIAIIYNEEECALQIFKMDTELISNMPSFRGLSLVEAALYKKMNTLALEILRSPHTVNCGKIDGVRSSPFHRINNIQGLEGSREIFRRILEREPELIKQKNEHHNTVFHMWAAEGRMWPFKLLLECNDIIHDVNGIFRDFISSTDNDGDNPLHCIALSNRKGDFTEVAELLMDIYKTDSLNLSYNQNPWLVKNNEGKTPISIAITQKKEDLAKYIMSMDENVVIESEKNLLFLAIENQCHIVAEEILKIVDNKGWTQLLTNEEKLNILHLAPLCKENFYTQLIEGRPELIRRVDKKGSTIIHSWIKSDKEVLFKFILSSKWKDVFVKLIDARDYNDRNNLFHVAATTTHEATTTKILQLLVEAYKEKFISHVARTFNCQYPWFIKNKQNDGPLHLAIRNQREELALYILSLLKKNEDINELLDYYSPSHGTLFLSMQYNCTRVAEDILTRLDKKNWTKYLEDPSYGRNILHLAPNLKDEKFGKFLVNVVPEFITKKDVNEQSAWDKAYEIGSAWFIGAVLDKDPSVFYSAPLVWIKACEKGHVSALCALIEHNPGAFRDLCILHKDSPLHHIRLPNLTGYEEFLKIKRMKDLINLQDSKGETPLHKAIRKRDLFLTETLLSCDKIIYDIMDDEDVSAVDLLDEECDNNQAWDRMCKRIGLDPKIKTTYFQRHTNMLEVRNSLFVVAALLATITFTAGFTLPGGFDQETGEALLATKTSFLVFLVSDTLALFFSMLVLICLIWSMVYDSSKSLFLIDRSMVFLRLALNCTLLAFMTGVYIVTSSKSLWAAIFIIVIISLLIGISINKTLLYNSLWYLDKLNPSSTKKPKGRSSLVLDELVISNEQDLMNSHLNEN